MATLADLFGGPARILSCEVAGLAVLLLDAPHLYDRPGGPYVGAGGYDHPDNWARFAALGRAGALVGTGLVPGYRPDIVHAHDWQAALARSISNVWATTARARSSPSTTSPSRAPSRRPSSPSSACLRRPGASTASNTTARSAS